jgi:prefoldin subunit 5
MSVELEMMNEENGRLRREVATWKAALAKRDAEIAELTDVMAFIERWANHHAPKPHMDAEQALSVIQHHPSIKAITKQYSDGKVPKTHDPYAEIAALKAEVERLRKQYEALRQAYGLMHEGSK